jgi:putative peptidoglycan lipid II flippase
MVLIGSTVGLLASTLGRLYSSTYYSLKDTKTPLKFAVIRVLLTTALGYLFAFPLPKLLGLNPSWGTAGLTASAGLSGWIEFYLLRKALNKRIGDTGIKVKYLTTLWVCGLIASAIAFGVEHFVHMRAVFNAVIILSVYGLVYFGVTYLLKVEESKITIDKTLAKVRRFI